MTALSIVAKHYKPLAIKIHKVCGPVSALMDPGPALIPAPPEEPHSTPVQAHSKADRPQGDGGLRGGVAAGDQVEPEALGDGRQQQRGLEGGEAAADALPAAAAE